MARNGKPPMPREGNRCRACALAEKPAMNDGLFCVDHELLWIAKAGVTSNNLHRKHGKMYRQFLKQQSRESHMDRNRRLLRGMFDPKDQFFDKWSKNVHPTALRGFGQGLQGSEEESQQSADGDGLVDS